MTFVKCVPMKEYLNTFISWPSQFSEAKRKTYFSQPGMLFCTRKNYWIYLRWESTIDIKINMALEDKLKLEGNYHLNGLSKNGEGGFYWRFLRNKPARICHRCPKRDRCLPSGRTPHRQAVNFLASTPVIWYFKTVTDVDAQLHGHLFPHFWDLRLRIIAQ